MSKYEDGCPGIFLFLLASFRLLKLAKAGLLLVLTFGNDKIAEIFLTPGAKTAGYISNGMAITHLHT